MMSDDQIAQAQGQIDAAYAALDEAKNTLDQSGSTDKRKMRKNLQNRKKLMRAVRQRPNKS